MDTQVDPLSPMAERPVRSDFLVFGSPAIEQDEIDEVVDSLKSGWISTGPKVARFEQQFAEYIGAPYRARPQLVHRGPAPVTAGRGCGSG